MSGVARQSDTSISLSHSFACCPNPNARLALPAPSPHATTTQTPIFRSVGFCPICLLQGLSVCHTPRCRVSVSRVCSLLWLCCAPRPWVHDQAIVGSRYPVAKPLTHSFTHCVQFSPKSRTPLNPPCRQLPTPCAWHRTPILTRWPSAMGMVARRAPIDSEAPALAQLTTCLLGLRAYVQLGEPWIDRRAPWLLHLRGTRLAREARALGRGACW